ncbi:alpha-glycosidase [Pseudobutyrivibrio ruminis]|uniref:Alpha-glycosidase n=1 Tax=Pseudobutyrivibrio ruminis TaxID=46206 RepID=A0A2G3EBT8_9FIRM|nr:glycoside hydrolase family 13 protein [Pseudobutyrivibrio ruminis]PHU40756.1 alpha-glycosidase [Pseudobutyrivibrio ruminis]
MNLPAISHVPFGKDAYMIKEDTLVVVLKAAKGDLKKVSLFFGDRVDIHKEVQVNEVPMELTGSDELYDYFECVVKSQLTRICYYFQIEDFFGVNLFYSEYGFTEQMNRQRIEYFQYPYLRREDMIEMPEWTKDMVMYQIFPDSFASEKGGISGQSKRIKERIGADETDGLVEYRSNLGGNIKGIVENLDYIEDLGANCIYINPIFKANSYHKYDTVDYMDIDPCFGTIDDFKTLVKAAHKRGIKIILDGVFNHCGPDFFAFKDVLKKGKESKYVDWFYKLRFPIETKPYPNYEAFAYVASMPKLNTGNPEVLEYCCNVGRFWIRECGIDGWRMDVANEINHEFFREFKKAIRAENPDSFLIGEIWENSENWLLGDQFDSTMNYTFISVCKEFFAEESINVQQFDEKIQKMIHRYPYPVSLAQMNFLDTHDVGRFLSFCHGDERKLELALAFMMCAPGIPSIFYGDEKAMEGLEEWEYRRPMEWDRKTSVFDFYKKWTHIRKGSKALSRGNYRTEYIDNENRVYAFSRQYEDEKKTVIFNASEKQVCLNLGENVNCAPWSVAILE